uniref:At3g05675-like ankyrin-like domain-containing protein n=1 Tax=Musa acuminata subsp. malaccensis TaxID=214687 RepID=A0A804HMI1_MUSAM
MHERASPMVRYELSRTSANIFIALGRRKEVSVFRRHEIQCSKVMVWTYVNGLALLKGAGQESIEGKLERSNSYPHAEAATYVI